MDNEMTNLSRDADNPFGADSKESKLQIAKTMSSEQNETESTSIMVSRTKKNRRRMSQAPRVLFADQQESPEDSSVDELVEEAEDKESRNVEPLARAEGDDDQLTTESQDTFREIQVRTKKHLDSQPEVPEQLIRTSRLDEIEGFASRRRSTAVLGYTIDEMLSQHAQMPRESIVDQLENGSFPSTTTETPGDRPRFSENIGVKSMIVDLPSTDCLPPLEARAFAVVLQEALDQLGILEGVIPAEVDPRWDEGYQTIDEKYGTTEEPEVMFRTAMGLLPLVPTVSEKLQRDRTYIFNVLKSTIREIQCLRRYERLETEVDDIARILEGEHNLEVNNEIWTGQVTQLHELIEHERLKNEEEVTKLLLLAHDMNAAVDTAIFSNKSKSDYVERWEIARLNQQKLGLEIKEQEIHDALENVATLESDDQIISSEVRAFLQSNTQELEESVAAWSIRYNEESERLVRQINDVKEKIEFQKIHLESLAELKHEQQIFLNKCYEDQRLAEREIAYQEAINEAATLIQRLWRGYMVRHKLGTFEKLWETLLKKKNKKKKKRKKKKL